VQSYPQPERLKNNLPILKKSCHIGKNEHAPDMGESRDAVR
jgi:hypothetical protein